MSFNVAMLEAMREKGLSLDDVIDVLWTLEGGRPKPKIPARPANDRVRRLGSAERQRAYGNLCDRDGEACAECGRGAETFWRRNGTSCDEYGAQFTIVYPTSTLEVDHRAPLWAGGTNELGNLWLLCVECHKAKTAAEASQRRRA